LHITQVKTEHEEIKETIFTVRTRLDGMHSRHIGTPLILKK